MPMSDQKENIIIILLITIIVACIYGINKIPAPASRESVKIQQEINDLKQDLQRLTHPQTIQTRTMDWIYERGEFKK